MVCTGTGFLFRRFPLRDVTVRFDMSISMEQLLSQWTDFHELSSSKPTFNAHLVPLTLHYCTTGALNVVNVIRGIHNVNGFHEICYLKCFSKSVEKLMFDYDVTRISRTCVHLRYLSEFILE